MHALLNLVKQNAHQLLASSYKFPSRVLPHDSPTRVALREARYGLFVLQSPVGQGFLALSNLVTILNPGRLPLHPAQQSSR